MRERGTERGMPIHVDMLKEPAVYTAASANPTTVPLTSPTTPAMAVITAGSKNTGHSGGLFRLALSFLTRSRDASDRLLRSAVKGVGGLSSNGAGGTGGGFCGGRKSVKESRSEVEATREQMKKMPPMKMSVQKRVNSQIASSQPMPSSRVGELPALSHHGCRTELLT